MTMITMNNHNQRKTGHVVSMKVSMKTIRGVSLIELMVALLIGALVTLGLIQIFGASKASSMNQAGLSSIQENGRFATQYLQRQLRMVGFMGCGADVGRESQKSFVNHMTAYDGTLSNNEYRFQRPMEAFTAGEMTTPTELSDLTLTSGSDVLILRIFSEESVPVITITKGGNILTLNVGNANAAFLPTPNNPAVFALQNCRSADVFVGTLTGNTPGSSVVVNGRGYPNIYADPTVASCGSSACPWDFRISNAFLNAKPLIGDPSLNAEVHRAEYLALFVQNNPDTQIPGLFVRRYERNGITLGDPEELAEGVENMQLRFGYDTSDPPDGRVDEFRTADDVVDGKTDEKELDAAWQRVLSVRLGVLLRSPERAGVLPDESGNPRTYTILGTPVTPPENGIMHQVYETTVALRNRLFNS